MAGCTQPSESRYFTGKTVAQQIATDSRLSAVLRLSGSILRRGFFAGGGYAPVFIRDFNTFLPAQCGLLPSSAIKQHLILFLRLQARDGSVPVLYLEPVRSFASRSTTPQIVQTDSESSLVQAVFEYVACTKENAFLAQDVGTKMVLERLENALNFVRLHKTATRDGLVFSATTIDWGDVEPEANPGGALVKPYHLAISIYPNAMYLIAIDDFVKLLPAKDSRRGAWLQRRRSLAQNIRIALWDPAAQKFLPHRYIDGSPFPRSFDENRILFEGGTAVAIEAGLLSNAEIRAANKQMLDAQSIAGAFSIAGSVYPAYPARFFKSPIVCEYCYQNGGLWPWFAARMVRQLAAHGMVQEAYEELSPMLDLVLRDKNFFEWYTLNGLPEGSSEYKGTAGELALAIEAVRRAVATAPVSVRNAPARLPPTAMYLWSYNNLPPGYNWHAERNAVTGDTVYYGIAPSGVLAPVSPGDTVHVGPDSAFFYFGHAPPIRKRDLKNRFYPKPIP